METETLEVVPPASLKQHASMTILLLTDDLMLGSQVSAAAQHSGQTVRSSADLESLLSLGPDDEVRQVIVDLNIAHGQPSTALARFKAVCPADTTFLAIAPHVHTAKLEAAEKAGFDRVLTRGQFHRSMTDLFAE